MAKINNKRFHKGFYENTQEDIKTQLFKIKDENPKEEFRKKDCCYNAEIFLHGICHVFAYALHQQFGYDILELRSKSNLMVHWCCISNFDGKEIYIDVRGATTDYEELLMEFQPSMGKTPLKKKIKDLTNYSDEWEEDQVKFANEIISKYYNYYSL